VRVYTFERRARRGPSFPRIGEGCEQNGESLL